MAIRLWKKKMYIEVYEIKDSEIQDILSEWEDDIECVSLGKNSLCIGWKSRRAYRLRAWRADREFRDRFDNIFHGIDGKLIRNEWRRVDQKAKRVTATLVCGRRHALGEG